MVEIDVRIVQLEPMRMASAYGFGNSPEEQAWDQLLGWMKKSGLEVRGARYFGFNNPSPGPGSPNYGYEQWVVVGPEIEPSNGVRVVSYTGGLYAVARTKLGSIGQTWQTLSEWRENSPYKPAHHQWLEEMLTPPGSDTPFEEMILDLYLPIAE